MRRQGNISCSSKYDGACIARGVLTLDRRVTTVSRSDAKSSRISARHQSFLRRRHARAASLINCTAHRTQQRDGRQWSARLWAGAHGQPSRAAVRTVVMCSRSICSSVPRDSSHSLAAAAAAATAFHRVEVAISLLAPDSTRPSVRPSHIDKQ